MLTKLRCASSASFNQLTLSFSCEKLMCCFLPFIFMSLFPSNISSFSSLSPSFNNGANSTKDRCMETVWIEDLSLEPLLWRDFCGSVRSISGVFSSRDRSEQTIFLFFFQFLIFSMFTQCFNTLHIRGCIFMFEVSRLYSLPVSLLHNRDSIKPTRTNMRH